MPRGLEGSDKVAMELFALDYLPFLPSHGKLTIHHTAQPTGELPLLVHVYCIPFLHSKWGTL